MLFIQAALIHMQHKFLLLIYIIIYKCPQAWSMELSSFLRELGCPHCDLVEGPVSDRLASPRARLTLLDFLLTELMAAKMMAASNRGANNKDAAMNIRIQVYTQS